MPRAKVMLSLIVIFLAVALIGGATLAWFTAATDPIENVFTAGTVDIEAGGKSRIPNWNPGDKDDTTFCVKNTGSKKVNVRLNLTEAAWNPGPLRILVLYTPGERTLQLIGVEWASFCQGCTGEVGHLATVSAQYLYSSSSHPDGGLVLNNDYYFGVNFSNITAGPGREQDEVESWLSSGDNVNPFAGWCLDKDTTISAGSYNNVRVYDPFCNPDWYDNLVDDVGSGFVKAYWQNIDFNKIAYILNHDFMSRGYNSTEVQQAIWQYTNGSYYTARYYLGNAAEINAFVNGIAGGPGGDLLAALNAVDNVKWNVKSWEIKDEDGNLVASGNTPGDWVVDDNIIYFVARALEPGETLCFVIEVELIGSLTGNAYQGMDYIFKGFFEAVQSSNYAPYHEWGVNHYEIPPQ